MNSLKLKDAQAAAPPATMTTWVDETRQALVNTMNGGDVVKVFNALKTKALAGDLAAIKLFLQYAIGDPGHVRSKPAAVTKIVKDPEDDDEEAGLG